MRRRVPNLLTLLSLLLCVAVAALWVRGYRVSELVGVSAGEVEVIAGSHEGRILVGWQGEPGGSGFDYGYAGRGSMADGLWEYLLAESAWRFAGFSYTATRINDSDPTLTRVVGTPAWFLAVLAAAPAAAWTCRRRSRRRKARGGLCPRCGYDLRATPERCPECGDTPAEAAA